MQTHHMPPILYHLSRDCFVRKSQGYWIILNAARDEYLCMRAEDVASIGPYIHGWTAGQDLGVEMSDQSSIDIIHSLTSKGVLTCDVDDGKAFAESDHGEVTRAIAVSESTAVPLSGLGTLRFLWACLKVDWRLRTRTLHQILSSIHARRRRRPTLGPAQDSSRLSALVAAFNRLRPLYPRPYLCLFESLALLDFLASCGEQADMVFGVIADPFQAHCWLQRDSAVLNDDLERISPYLPILTT